MMILGLRKDTGRPQEKKHGQNVRTEGQTAPQVQILRRKTQRRERGTGST